MAGKPASNRRNRADRNVTGLALVQPNLSGEVDSQLARMRENVSSLSSAVADIADRIGPALQPPLPGGETKAVPVVAMQCALGASLQELNDMAESVLADLRSVTSRVCL